MLLGTRIFAECYAYLWDEFGSAGSYQGDDGVIQFNFGGVGGVWRSGNTRKRECWRYALVVGDMDGVVVRSYMAV
jgi:hypothetical protein